MLWACSDLHAVAFSRWNNTFFFYCRATCWSKLTSMGKIQHKANLSVCEFNRPRQQHQETPVIHLLWPDSTEKPGRCYCKETGSHVSPRINYMNRSSAIFSLTKLFCIWVKYRGPIRRRSVSGYEIYQWHTSEYNYVSILNHCPLSNWISTQEIMWLCVWENKRADMKQRNRTPTTHLYALLSWTTQKH